MNSFYSLDEYYNNNSNKHVLGFLDFVNFVLRLLYMLYLFCLFGSHSRFVFIQWCIEHLFNVY